MLTQLVRTAVCNKCSMHAPCPFCQIGLDEGLTVREMDTVLLIAAGNSIPTISIRLNCSQNTTEARLYAITAKLLLPPSRDSIAMWALSKGVVSSIRPSFN